MVGIKSRNTILDNINSICSYSTGHVKTKITMNKKTKKYLVVGLKKTGIETIKFLKDENMEVRGSDLSFANSLPVEINELYHSGIQIELGRHSDQYLEWCDEIVLSPGVSLNTPFAQKALDSGKKVTGEIELAIGL